MPIPQATVIPTVQNEADYHYRKDPELGFFSHVVGNGRVMQVGPVDNGAWDVGGRLECRRLCTS